MIINKRNLQIHQNHKKPSNNQNYLKNSPNELIKTLTVIVKTMTKKTQKRLTMIKKTRNQMTTITTSNRQQLTRVESKKDIIMRRSTTPLKEMIIHDSRNQKNKKSPKNLQVKITKQMRMKDTGTLTRSLIVIMKNKGRRAMKKAGRRRVIKKKQRKRK